MITPVLIQVLFWIASAGIVLFGLAALARGETFMAVAIIIVGPLIVRVYCELLILFFRMNETLTDISKSVGSSAAPKPITRWEQPAGWGSQVQTEA